MLPSRTSGWAGRGSSPRSRGYRDLLGSILHGRLPDGSCLYAVALDVNGPYTKGLLFQPPLNPQLTRERRPVIQRMPLVRQVSTQAVSVDAVAPGAPPPVCRITDFSTSPLDNDVEKVSALLYARLIDSLANDSLANPHECTSSSSSTLVTAVHPGIVIVTPTWDDCRKQSC